MELEAADTGQLNPSSCRGDIMRPLMTLALLALAVLCLAGQAGECPPLRPAEEEGGCKRRAPGLPNSPPPGSAPWAPSCQRCEQG